VRASLVAKYNYSDQVEEDEDIAQMGEKLNAYMVFVAKSKMKETTTKT
jgi:hypothetical protein